MFCVTREIDFCYGHRLLNYEGKCRYLHGHNGRAVITLESNVLDSRGMVIDFSDIKRVVSTWIDDTLDHRMVLHREDPVVPLLEEMGEPMHFDYSVAGACWGRRCREKHCWERDGEVDDGR